MNKRTAREISVNEELLSNKNINIKIGTVENRNFPETIYIYISFWVDSIECDKEESKYFRHKLSNSLNAIYNKKFIEKQLKSSSFFVSEKENIFICNIPENFNCNNKPSFVSMELYLHTNNIDLKKYPLNAKKDTDLFNECLKVGNEIGNKISKIKGAYRISNTQKKLLKK